MSGALPDVEYQSVGSLLIGKNPEHRQQQAQVSGYRGLADELPVEQELQLTVDIANGRVALGHYVDSTGITVQESFRRYCQILHDEGKQRDDVTFDGLQLLVEVTPRLAHRRPV